METQSCVFIRKQPFSIIVIYVDDGLVVAKSQQIVDELLKDLSELFDIHSCDGKTYLGFQIHKLQDRIIINQTTFINKILDKFHMDKEAESSVPMSKYSSDDDVSPLEEPNNFRQILGSLLYAAETARPDIYFSVNQISRFQSSPRKIDYQKLQVILAYLNHTRSLGLCFRKSDEFDLEIFSDSDLAGDPVSGCSTTGYIMLFCGAPVLWKSKRQKMVATSSYFAETIAIFQTLEQTGPHIEALKEIGLGVSRPIPMFVDNKAAVQTADHIPQNAKSRRHFHIKRCRIKEAIDNKEVTTSHIPAVKQLADIFTKVQAPCLFKKTVGLLMTSLIFLALLTGQGSAEVEHFKRAKNLVFVPVNEYVDNGTTVFNILFTYVSPCNSYTGLLDELRYFDK